MIKTALNIIMFIGYTIFSPFLEMISDIQHSYRMYLWARKRQRLDRDVKINPEKYKHLLVTKNCGWYIDSYHEDKDGMIF